MNDKRDEVIEAAKVWADERWGVQERSNYQNWDVIDATDFALSRETELRRQIADELQRLYGNWVSTLGLALQDYIEKLRGSK